MSKLFLQLDPFQVLIMEKPSMNPKPIERKKSNNKKIASTGCPSKFGSAEQYSKDHKSCEWGEWSKLAWTPCQKGLIDFSGSIIFQPQSV